MRLDMIRILKKTNRLPKLDDHDLSILIRECLETGKYFQSIHFIEMMEERNVSFPDSIHVLRNGNHEKKKTQFHAASNKWRYAIRGKTTENVEIRVVITFDDDNMVIITVIDLVNEEII